MKKAAAWLLVLAAALATGGTIHARENGRADNGRAYYDFGVFAHEDGDYAEAAHHFRMALEFQPENAAFHHYLGRTLLAQKRYEEAAVHLDRAMAINPDIPGLKYDAAMLNFQQGDNARAATLFERAAAESPDDVLARYYAGVTRFQMGQYEESAEYFLAAAEKSPEARVRGRYYAAVAYQKDGQSRRALSLFQAVIDDPEAGEFAQLARDWAETIRQGGETEREPWSLYLKLGRRYDDNVALDPDDGDLFTEESDWATHAFFSGRYEFRRLDPLNFGIGYRHYWMDYDDLDEYDLNASFGDLYAAYRFAPFTARLVYSPRYFWANDQRYLRRHGFGPDLLWRPHRRLLTRFAYRFKDNRYFRDEDRDGEDQTLFGEAYFTFLQGTASVFGRLEYEDRSAEDPDEEYGQWRTRLGGKMELPWKLEAGLSGEYRARDYDAPNPFYGVEREDDRYELGMSLSRPVLYDWLGVLLEYRHIRNDSNINDFEYTRNQITFSVTAIY
jgi:tetratricopeptide (TPR) repeat protein